MKESEINNYLEYWMEGDSSFNAILSDSNNAVEDVEYHESFGVPRAVV